MAAESQFDHKPVKANKGRAPRFDMSSRVQVQTKTLGAEISYGLTTRNVSRSGLLLTWEQGSRVPFIENTLVEMTIDPHQSLLDIPVNCMGKVVRRVDNFSEESQQSMSDFGVQIVQIDGNDLVNWEACITALAQKVKQLNVIDHRSVVLDQKPSTNK